MSTTMTQLFRIHPQSPQRRLVTQAVALIRAGGLAVYPTDSCYAFGCHMGNKQAMERIARIRALDDGHNFTLVCRDLSELSSYARVDNSAFRLLKSFTPGPYTFILRASSEVPKRLQNPKRRSIGLRVPDNAIAQSLLDTLGEPLMSTTLLLPADDLALSEPDEILERLEGHIDLFIDGGACGVEPTTVVDLMGERPKVLRHGRGDARAFES